MLIIKIALIIPNIIGIYRFIIIYYDYYILYIIKFMQNINL